MQPATLELEFGAELRRPQAPSVSEFGAVVAKSSLPPWSWSSELALELEFGAVVANSNLPPWSWELS